LLCKTNSLFIDSSAANARFPISQRNREAG
jgi:hypothetical protein